MIYWAIFAIEMVILFLTSKFIFQALYILSYKVFRNEHSATIPLFLLFFPGVIIHELSHLLIAEILFVKSYDIEIWPRVTHGRLRMGSVQIQETDLIRRVLIGAAPVVVGVSFLASVILVFINYVGFQNIFTSSLNSFFGAVVVWIVFVVTNTMFSSKKDVEGALELFLTFSFVFFVFLIASLFLKIDLIALFSKFAPPQQTTMIVENLVLLLSFPLLLNGVIFFVARIFLRRFILGRVVRRP